MLAAPVMTVALVAALMLTALYSLAKTLGPSPWAVRGNNLATGSMSLLLVALNLGWLPSVTGAIIWGLGTAVLWFLLQALLHRRPWLQGDSSVAGALYRGALMAVTAWIIATNTTRAAQSGPFNSLGFTLAHLIVAIMLIFTAAAWLLATFATPRQDTGATPIRPMRGIHETLLAAGMAATLLAML